MKVLGRELVPPFDAFWSHFTAELDLPAELVEKGSKSVFGTEGYIEGSPALPRWMELPDGALSYHVAHELTHLVLRRRGFPVTMRGRQYADDSPEARIGGDLSEMVDHTALEELLKPFSFDRSHIQRHLFEGARRGLEESPVPPAGTLWWATWACRFCELQFLLPARQWLRLEVVYDARCPDIADKGRELVEILNHEGLKTPPQALAAMVKARDVLGLKEEGRCLVRDPLTGGIY